MKAVGIEEIDRRYSVVCLKRGSGFGIRQFAVYFIGKAFRRILIDVVYGHREMRDHTLLLGN